MHSDPSSIFVKPDDPKFLAKIAAPERELVSLNTIDVESILAAMKAREANYDTTPFDPEGNLLRLYPGGVSIWSGFPGSGKSTILRQLTTHLLQQGCGVFVASLEEEPLDVFFRHAMVALGQESPTAEGLQWCVDMWHGKLSIWHGTDQAQHAKLFAALRVLGAQGTRHAIIDSLMCLDIHNSDWEGQRQFANAMRATARDSGVHIHLVAHPRKLISTGQDPDLNDVAGAREIGGLADNVLFIRRDKDAGMTNNTDVTPMQIAVLKQRHFRGALGKIDGWFNRRLKQFKCSKWDEAPTAYLPHYAYEEPRALAS